MNERDEKAQAPRTSLLQELATRPGLRRVLPRVKDVIELLSGKLDHSTPPCTLRTNVGPFWEIPKYREVGEVFLRHITDLCSLRPSEHVLDVGCGTGQMAVQLTRYLDRTARYEGFDIGRKMIEWDRKNISSRYPNFNFQLADVYNKLYNPTGKHNASDYRFPYPDESFDFVILKSVFTHMLPKDMENYLSEISRVLRPDGRCLISSFLLNDQSVELVDKGMSRPDFRYAFENYRVEDKDLPESAVAYDERYLRRLFENHGLNIVAPIHYGSWCGRKDFLNYQDLVVARK